MKNKILYIILILFVLINIKDINVDIASNSKIIKYNGDNLLISIDGVSSSSIPSDGDYYLVNFECNNLNTKVTWDRKSYKLNISNKKENAGVSCNLEFKSNPLLSEMPVGSYVLYEGNNGCEGNHCKGYNANYESEEKMGYCEDPNFQFYVNGWRLGYIEDGSAVLISAGSPECMCTSADGSLSNAGCDGELLVNDIDKHYENMQKVALKYCNENYIKTGSCNLSDNNYIKVIDADVFSKIIGKPLNKNSCSSRYGDTTCGYNNDLIDNGSYYWFSTQYDSSSYTTFTWGANGRSIFAFSSLGTYGVRPVLTLDSSVIVTSGDGTYESPYLIDNNYFVVGDGSGILNSNNDLSNVELSFNSIVDVSKMCISVDTSSCSNYIDYSDTYSLDLSNAGTGEKIIYVYYKDAYNKIVAAMQRTVVINNES